MRLIEVAVAEIVLAIASLGAKSSLHALVRLLLLSHVRLVVALANHHEGQTVGARLRANTTNTIARATSLES
jgi:hypothetical protein